jgi:Icc-related predicted phosphoesterase
MFRFAYVTDIHGWREGYEAALDFARRQACAAIVNGGDMLPKGSGILKEQKHFITSYLRDHFHRCREYGIAHYGMFGNDDLASRLTYWREVLVESPGAFDLTERWHELPDGSWLRGVNWVPDHPFGRKDWSVLDTRDFERPLQFSDPIISGPTGFQRIPDIKAFFAGRPTMAEVLDSIVQDAPDTSRAIVVTHAPPTGTGLATLGGILRGKDVGSRAVHDWIQRHQPLLTLHGHIHESPEVSGTHTARIGRTLCHQPGQKAQMALTASIIEIAGVEVKIERHVLVL